MKEALAGDVSACRAYFELVGDIRRAGTFVNVNMGYAQDRLTRQVCVSAYGLGMSDDEDQVRTVDVPA